MATIVDHDSPHASGATAAHAAAFTGDIQTLIGLGKQNLAVLRAKTEDGETPAHHAAAAGMTTSLELFGSLDVALLSEQDAEGW